VPTFTQSRPVRFTAGLALVASAALALAGCGRVDNSNNPASSITVDNSPATGAVTLWAPDNDANALEDILASFRAENPDLNLEITLTPSDEYTTKLQAAIASGTGPDIAQTFTESQAGVIGGGSFAPVPEGLVDSSVYFPGSWAAGELNGVAYTVPWYAYTYTLVYRKDLAEAAGVTPPGTWEESIPFMQGLQSAGAVRGLGADVGWDIYNGQGITQLVWQAGGDVISEDGSEWTLNTPEMVKAMEYNASFFTSGIADTDGPGFLDSQPSFVSGKTAAMVTGPWVLGQLDTVAAKDGWTAENVGTAVVPAGAAGNTGAVAGGSWGVLSTSNNQDAAWKVVRHFSEPDVQLAQYEAYGSLPAVQSVWQNPVIADQPLLKAFFTQLQNTRGYPQNSTWVEVATRMGTEMEAVAKGTVSAEKAAASLQTFADGVGTGK
jgi:multiple sugar transport system substrate-binding protein